MVHDNQQSNNAIVTHYYILPLYILSRERCINFGLCWIVRCTYNAVITFAIYEHLDCCCVELLYCWVLCFFTRFIESFVQIAAVAPHALSEQLRLEGRCGSSPMWVFRFIIVCPRYVGINIMGCRLQVEGQSGRWGGIRLNGRFGKLFSLEIPE